MSDFVDSHVSDTFDRVASPKMDGIFPPVSKLYPLLHERQTLTISPKFAHLISNLELSETQKPHIRPKSKIDMRPLYYWADIHRSEEHPKESDIKWLLGATGLSLDDLNKWLAVVRPELNKWLAIHRPCAKKYDSTNMEVRIVQKGERKPNLSLKMILKRSKMTTPLLRRRYSGPVGRGMECLHIVGMAHTAIDDEQVINAALPVADSLRGEHGVQIITVNVGKSTSVYLPKLATYSFVSPTYKLDGSLLSKIVNTSCINSGVTYPTPPPTSTVPYNPSPTPSSPYVNGGDGPLCAANHKQAWLDLVFVIEHSSATFAQWNAITSSISSTVSQLTLSNTLSSGHTSRIAVITYDLTGTKVQFNFTAEQTTRNILVALNRAKPGLKAAGDYLTANANFRAPGVVLYAATYDDYNTDDPISAAYGLKMDLIKIATVSFDASNGVNSQKIGNLASPGLVSNMHNPVSQLLWAVSQLNCRCAHGWSQLTVNTVSYAECFFYEDASAFQALTLCQNTDTDILALASTPGRVDFIGQLVSKEKPTNVISIGLSRTDGSAQWSWQKVYPYSGYPAFAQQVSETDVYGYLSKSNSNTWQLLADDGMTTGRFYVCQRRSGDTDNIVEL
uniref:VWFA domain-containing protein n=1 Tax=Panagrellus redivivus TaxID=6233 RepID=A0A7E4VP13_PANRE